MFHSVDTRTVEEMQDDCNLRIVELWKAFEREGFEAPLDLSALRPRGSRVLIDVAVPVRACPTPGVTCSHRCRRAGACVSELLCLLSSPPPLSLLGSWLGR